MGQEESQAPGVEKGPLTSGLNMIEPYFDFDSNLRFKRLPFNKFLLDPTFTERDLSDCRYIIRGEPISKSDAAMMFPDHVDEIARYLVSLRLEARSLVRADDSDQPGADGDRG